MPTSILSGRLYLPGHRGRLAWGIVSPPSIISSTQWGSDSVREDGDLFRPRWRAKYSCSSPKLPTACAPARTWSPLPAPNRISLSLGILHFINFNYQWKQKRLMLSDFLAPGQTSKPRTREKFLSTIYDNFFIQKLNFYFMRISVFFLCYGRNLGLPAERYTILQAVMWFMGL